jgi:hypothetical protein
MNHLKNNHSTNCSCRVRSPWRRWLSSWLYSGSLDNKHHRLIIQSYLIIILIIKEEEEEEEEE